MKTDLFLPVATAALLAMMVLGLSPDTADARQERSVEPGKIRGKIQFVESFPDYRVQVVKSFPDLRVEMVKAFPDKPGKWQRVDSFPDYRIQLVESFPDFTIEYVNALPGKRE